MTEELTIVTMPAPAASLTVRDILMVLFRQKRLLVITFAILSLGIFLYGLVAPPYRTEMIVLIRHGRLDPKIMALPSTAPQLERDEVTEEELNSEVELLHDEAILRTVALNAKLDSLGASWFWDLLGETREARQERAARRLSKRLDVEAVKKTSLINVTYTSSNPVQGAEILRYLEAAYLARHSKLRRPSGEFNFFDEQWRQARQELQGSELALVDFTREANVVSAGAQRDLEIQKLGQADASENEVRISISETVQRIKSLQSKLQSFPERTTTRIKNLDNPDLMGKLKSKLLDLELNRTDLLMKYGPSYRLVKEVDEQVSQTKALIAAQDKEPLREQTSEPDANHEWTKSELERTEVALQQLLARSAATRLVVASYQDTARQLGERAIRQQELENNLRAAEDRYLLYASKREEARIADALDQGGIVNVTIAEEPVAPPLPEHSAFFFGLAAVFIAGAASTGVAFAADSLTPAFRTPEEVISYLGSPVLASLPRKSTGEKTEEDS